MTKRLQQQPPKTPRKKPAGVIVYLEEGTTASFTNAVGWNWDPQNGILNIASAEKVEQQQNGQTVLVNGLLASFRKWVKVQWL